MRPCLGILIVMVQASSNLTLPDSATGAERFAVLVEKDIEYATVDGHSLKLDLYRPDGAKNVPLVVWVHGGAWRAGSKNSMPLQELVRRGYAIASVDYRLSPVAKFPAQIHDIKAAVRFVRAEAGQYGYNADSIGIAGSSAGGHLVALMGVSNGNSSLEGTVGKHLDQSSSVQAVVDFYGPTNFLTILKQSTPHGLSVRVPALQLLLGARPDDKKVLATLASPVFHVDRESPPLLLIHGDQDPQVPINQSHELHGRYKKAGLAVQFEVVHGGAHGGPEFYDETRIDLVQGFFETYLQRRMYGSSRVIIQK